MSRKERESWVVFGAAADAHRSLLFVIVFQTRDVLVRGGWGGDDEGEEGSELCGCGADGEIECDSLGAISRHLADATGLTHLLFADGVVLVASIAQDMTVAAGIPTQAGFAGSVEY